MLNGGAVSIVAEAREGRSGSNNGRPEPLEGWTHIVVVSDDLLIRSRRDGGSPDWRIAGQAYSFAFEVFP